MGALDDFLSSYEEEKKRKAEQEQNFEANRESLLNNEYLENLNFEPPPPAFTQEELNISPGLELRASKESFGDKIKRIGEQFGGGLLQGTMAAPAVERIMKVSENKAIEQGRMRPEYAQFQDLDWMDAPAAQTKGEKAAHLIGDLTGMMAPVGGLYARAGVPLTTKLIGEGTSLAARAGKHFLPGAIAGGIYGAAEGGLEEGTAKAAGQKALEEALLFGGGDVALRGAAKVAGAAGKTVLNKLFERATKPLDDIVPRAPDITPTSELTVPEPRKFRLADKATPAMNRLNQGMEEAQNLIGHNDIYAAYPPGTKIDDALLDIKSRSGVDIPQLISDVEKIDARGGLRQQVERGAESAGLRQAAGVTPVPERLARYTGEKRAIEYGAKAADDIRPPEVGQPKVGTAAYAGELKTPEEALNKYAEAVHGNTGERPVVALSEAATPAEIKTATTAKKVGVEVRYFESNSKFGDTEFVDPELPGVVFVRKGTDVDPRWVTGHGFVHTLRVNHPELYQGLYKAIGEGVTAGQRHEYLQKLTDNPKYREAMMKNPEGLVEEILADEGGNLFTNKQFWEYLSDEKPGLFERIVTAAKAFFNRLTGRQQDLLGNFDNTMQPEQIIKFREEFAKIIDEVQARQYNKTSGLDMLGETRGRRSRTARILTPADKSSFSVPEAMEKDALGIQFATRIDREEALPNGLKRAFYTINASTGKGIQGILEYSQRSFKKFGSEAHDETSLKAIREQIESIPKEKRDSVLNAEPGNNKLENQPLLALSRGCYRNGAVLQAIADGVLPPSLKKWLTSCHGACYKNYDNAATTGASLVSNLKTQAKKYINDPVGAAAQKAEYDTLKKVAQEMGVDLPDSEILAKKSLIFDKVKSRFRESLPEEKQSQYYNEFKEKGFWKPWTTQENMAPIVATPEEAANFVKNMKPKTWDMLTKGDHNFIRSNQQGDWLLEVASGTFESFMDAMAEKGFRESGKKISVVTTGWYADVPMETLKRIAQKHGDQITVQVTSGFDFSLGEATLRLQGFDKLRKAGFNPVMRVITDEFGVGGANLNHPDAVKKTLQYIVDNKLTPFDVLDTPLHIDAPGFKILNPSPKNIASLTKRVQDLWDIPTEDAADLAMRIIKRNQVFYREVGEQKVGHEEVGITYDRLKELGVSDDLIQGLKDLGFNGKKSNGKEQVFPAICCTTGKCTSCTVGCMNKFNRATDYGKIFTPKAQEIVKDLSPTDAGSLVYSARNYENRVDRTSLKQIPALFKYIRSKGLVKPGDTVLDIGGGKHDLGKEYLEAAGPKVHIYDTFTRGLEHNAQTLSNFKGKKADVVTAANVLNVVEDAADREGIIAQAAAMIKPDGKVYFGIYTGSRNGIGAKTKTGSWQNNLPAQAYENEISQYFANVTRRGDNFIAEGPLTESIGPEVLQRQGRQWKLKDGTFENVGQHDLSEHLSFSARNRQQRQGKLPPDIDLGEGIIVPDGYSIGRDRDSWIMYSQGTGEIYGRGETKQAAYLDSGMNRRVGNRQYNPVMDRTGADYKGGIRQDYVNQGVEYPLPGEGRSDIHAQGRAAEAGARGVSEAGREDLFAARNRQQRTTNIPGKMEYLGKGQRARSFPVSVNESQMASPEVKAAVAAEIKPGGKGAYVPDNLHELDTKAAEIVANDPVAAERMLLDGEAGGIKTAVGIRLIEHHQKLGDHKRAGEIALDLSTRLTKAGQESAAAKIMGALDPQGVLVFAQRQIKKINEKRLLPRWTKELELTPQDSERLSKLAQAVKDAPDEASKVEASQILQDALNSLRPSGIGKKLATTQTIAQLWNPKTHIRNTLGNEIFYYMERASKYVATPIDWTRSKLTGSDRTVTIATGTNGFWGDFFDGYRYFKEGVKKGVAAGYKGVNPDGIQTQFDLGHGLAFKSEGWQKPMSWLERTMGAALKGMDYAAYNRAKQQLIGEMAVLKTINTHGKYDKQIAQNYAKTFDANVEEMARKYGKYCTYQDDNLISKGLARVKRGLNLGMDFGLGDIALKYPRTPGALVARGLEYSPAGFLRAGYQLAKPYLTTAKPDPREVTLALGRAIIGAGGVTGMGWALADMGILTGRASKDKDLNALQKNVGEGPFRVNLSALKRFVTSGFDRSAAKIKQSDLLVSYDWAQPIAIALGMGASAAQDIKQKAGFKKSAGNASSVAASSLESGLNTVAEQPVLQGLARLFQGYSLGDNVTQTAKSVPASFTPTLANQIRQLVDNQARTTYDPNWLKEAGNYAQAKILGLAGDLPPAYDTFGNPRKTHEEMGPIADLLNVMLNPSIPSHFNPSPQAQRAVGLAEDTGDLRHIPRVPPKYLTVDGKRIDLTPEEYAEYQRLLGQLTAANYGTGSGTSKEQIDALANMISDANAAVKELLLAGRGIKTGGDSKKSSKTASKKSFL